MNQVSTPLPPWEVPPNYQAVDSQIPGITVYAPVKAKTEVEAPVTFKCPQCGAATRYDVAAGGVACEHCGFQTQANGQQVGRQAEKLEFTLETVAKAEQGWGTTGRMELHCDSCGASLAVENKDLSITCPFCASNRVNLRQAAEDQLRPRFLIPFKIPVENNRRVAKEWLSKGWFHPDTLGQASVLDRFLGIYLPFWTFTCHIQADWKAEVGYERTERYYDSSSKEWKSRTVIDWRWENGRVNVQLEDWLISGSSHISKKILSRIQPFDLGDLVAYLPDYLAGWQAHAYDIPLTQAWEEGKSQMREKARDACYADISSSHVRNFTMVADFADESWRYVLLPVYLASYKFEDKVYQVMINGQTGTIAGQKPVAWWKVWSAIAAMLAPGVLGGLISLPLLLAGGLGAITLVISFIVLGIGAAFAISLYRKAVDSEAA